MKNQPLVFVFDVNDKYKQRNKFILKVNRFDVNTYFSH